MRAVLAPVLLTLAVAGCAADAPTAPYSDAFADAELAPYSITPQAYRGTTLDHLINANWDCQQRVPGLISCAPPGIGLPPIPSLGESGRPVYQIAVFTLAGTPFGTAHFVRADLYRGQTCTFTGEPFVLRAHIGYYECLRVY